MKRLPVNLEFTEMRHGDVMVTLQRRHRSMCGNPGLVCEKQTYSTFGFQHVQAALLQKFVFWMVPLHPASVQLTIMNIMINVLEL